MTFACQAFPLVSAAVWGSILFFCWTLFNVASHHRVDHSAVTLASDDVDWTTHSLMFNLAPVSLLTTMVPGH